jgi:quercetin dioxygenase-like cupin family protein
VRLIRTDADGRAIGHYGSDFVHVRLAECEAAALSRLRLEAGGRVGRHPAAAGQLFIVVEGKGFVRGGEGEEEPIAAGEAAFWEPGEEHDARTDEGLTAIVLESDRIDVRAPER